PGGSGAGGRRARSAVPDTGARVADAAGRWMFTRAASYGHARSDRRPDGRPADSAPTRSRRERARAPRPASPPPRRARPGEWVLRRAPGVAVLAALGRRGLRGDDAEGRR